MASIHIPQGAGCAVKKRHKIMWRTALRVMMRALAGSLRRAPSPVFPVNKAAVRSDDWTFDIISAAARPLPEASQPPVQAILWAHKIIAISAQFLRLAAPCAVIQSVD